MRPRLRPHDMARVDREDVVTSWERGSWHANRMVERHVGRPAVEGGLSGNAEQQPAIRTAALRARVTICFLIRAVS